MIAEGVYMVLCAPAPGGTFAWYTLYKKNKAMNDKPAHIFIIKYLNTYALVIMRYK